MRTSHDLYMLPNGDFVSVSCDQQAPEGATLWTGYDYKAQCWVFEGRIDTRTLEELQATQSCL